MSIKYKHCCTFNELDYIEVDKTLANNKDVIRVSSYDSDIKTQIDLYLDKKTAIRFAKSIRTEINKIDNNG